MWCFYQFPGLPYVSPSHEVKRLAKEVGMEGKVKVLNFGVKGQMAELRRVVNECIQTGYWLLLQNYHLAEEPEQDFFNKLKVRQTFVSTCTTILIYFAAILCGFSVEFLFQGICKTVKIFKHF